MNSRRHSAALLLLFILLTSLFLPGCWSSHDLNDQYIVLGIAIDKVGDKVRLTLQGIRPEKINSPNQQSSGGSEQLPFFILSYDGDSIQEAYRGIDHITPKFVYGGHVQVIYIGEALAREGMMPYLDFFARNRWSLDSSWIIIAKEGTGQKLLTIANSLTRYPSKGLEDLARKRQIHISNLFQFLLNYYGDSGMQVLAFAKPRKEKAAPPDFQLNQFDMQQGALIRGDRLVGYLSDADSETYNWLQDGFNKAHFSLKSTSAAALGLVGLRLKGAPAKIQTVDSDGLTIKVEVQIDFDISENAPALQGAKEITALEEKVNQTLSQRIESLFLKLQQENLDVFDMAENVHAHHSQLWQKLKVYWPEVYAHLPIQINVDSHYRSPITMAKSPGVKE